MKKMFLFPFFIYFLIFSQLANAKDNTLDAVKKFKQIIQTDNPETIAKLVEYPFRRRYPLPVIHNQEEFIKNYDIIFDSTLKSAILDSNFDDWSSMGWRGIMLYSGMLWINPNGELITVNYKTDAEIKYIDEWFKNDRENLYSTLKTFIKNIYVFETFSYIGRIDKMTDNSSTYDVTDKPILYRLSLWPKDKKMSDEPAIVINNGTVEYQGSANNTFYTFIDNDYQYDFEVTYVGSEDTPPYALYIHRNGTYVSGSEATLLNENHQS